jgi:hypothetical protein
MRQPTPLQQAASRSNGAKSRGPKNAAGKRRSSRIGCRHNLFSRVAPMPPAGDPDFLERLADYRADFKPRTPAAERAVLSLPVNMWLKTHLWSLETEMWDAEVRRQAALHPLQQLQRMDSRYGQGIFRALRTLEKEEKDALRAERRAAKTAKMQHQTPPAPGTRDFSRVFAAQQRRTTPKNNQNEAPNLTPPSPAAPPVQPPTAPDHTTRPGVRSAAAPKNDEIEAPNLTRPARSRCAHTRHAGGSP